MRTPNEVKEWYDHFSSAQVETGINLRHYHIFNEVVRAGLKRHHKVLEIGCGIGTLTKLLGAYVTKGKIVATDISDESIRIAKHRLRSYKNIECVVSDMRDFQAPEKFDVVILPDVLEHIPMDDHGNLFHVIADLMHPASKLIIHIPHPTMIEYLTEHRPDKLQVIDQAVHADVLCARAYQHNLRLEQYSAYALFDREYDYVLMILKLNTPVAFHPKPKLQIIRNKMVARTKYVFHRYL